MSKMKDYYHEEICHGQDEDYDYQYEEYLNYLQLKQDEDERRRLDEAIS